MLLIKFAPVKEYLSEKFGIVSGAITDYPAPTDLAVYKQIGQICSQFLSCLVFWRRVQKKVGWFRMCHHAVYLFPVKCMCAPYAVLQKALGETKTQRET